MELLIMHGNAEQAVHSLHWCLTARQGLHEHFGQRGDVFVQSSLGTIGGIGEGCFERKCDSGIYGDFKHIKLFSMLMTWATRDMDLGR